LRIDLAAPTGSSLIGFQQTGSGTVLRTAQAKMRETVSVKDFGAVGDGVTDDTVAIQAAVDSGAACVHFPQGTYKVVTSSTPSFDYGNTTIGTYVAIDIDRSNLTITGDNAVINLFAATAAAGRIVYAFATAKNMTLGAISNISISGLQFEFNPTGKTGATYRSISIIGCRGVALDNLFLYSSGSRFGATVTLQNCQQVRFSNMRWRNTTQGINFSYVDDVQFENLMFDYFSEAIDFDRMVSRCNANNVNFTSTFGTASGQCWDLNSVRWSNFSNITANNCGNVMLINYKDTTPETYAEYVANSPVINMTPSKGIHVNGVTIKDCGTAGTAGVLTVESCFDPAGPCEDVTYENVYMENSGMITITPGKNVKLKNIYIKDGKCSVGTGFGQISCLKGLATSAVASCVLENVVIDGCQQQAFRGSIMDYGIFKNVTIKDWASVSLSRAIDIQAQPSNGKIVFEDMSFQYSSATTGKQPVRVTDASSGAAVVQWRGANSVSSNIGTSPLNPLEVSGPSAALMIDEYHEVNIMEADVGSGQTKYIPLVVAGAEHAYVFDVRLYTSVSVPADAVNYLNLAILTNAGTVASGSTIAGVTAGTAFSLNFAYPETLALLAPGDTMYLRLVAVGTGQTLPAVTLKSRRIIWELD